MTLWSDYIAPVLRRPPHYQVAALCYRPAVAGAGVEILMVTSLHTRRWILPKGWPKTGMGAAAVAAEEAWEEAGMCPAQTPPCKIGRYRYVKRRRGGVPAPTEVDVFAFAVAGLDDDYPEAGRRTRRWMTPAEAAEAVDEDDLAALLRRVPEMRLPEVGA